MFRADGARLICELPVGHDVWKVSIPDVQTISHPRHPDAEENRTVEQLVHAALESPFHFESLRRALTPDDRVALVVDENTPGITSAVAVVLKHLGLAGIAMTAVTIVSPASAPANWLDELPAEFEDVKTEIHDPQNRQRLAYLASTRSDRRVYLNRTILESDFIIVIGHRRFDARSGVAGGEDLVYPRLSDQEAIDANRGQLRYKEATPSPDANEVVQLIGSPFFVQLIDDGVKVVDVVAGLPNCLPEAVRRHNNLWRTAIPQRPDLVIATTSPTPNFLELATAAVNAARAVDRGGRIVLLAPPVEMSGEGVQILRQSEDPREARSHLTRTKPDDWTACHLWTAAAHRARVYMTNIEENDAEELFASAIGNAAELERLAATAERVLILNHAHRSIVQIRETA